MSRILITGATGTVGSDLIKIFARENLSVCAAMTKPEKSADFFPNNVESRRLDFRDVSTFGAALAGISKVFLMLPPGLSDLANTIFPFISACRIGRVEQIVLLSILGAENAGYLPHRKIEKEILRQQIAYTFLRPSYFNQNFLTAHLDEIRRDREIFIPAGNGKTSFIDTRDIAETAFKTLFDDSHLNRAYELTGAEALSFDEAAAIFTEVLGETVRYTNPSLLYFVWRNWEKRKNLTFALVMAAIYTSTRFGRAAAVTEDLPRLLDRPPISFKSFVRDYAAVWK